MMAAERETWHSETNVEECFEQAVRVKRSGLEPPWPAQ